MLEFNIDFVTIYIFFFSSEWIAGISTRRLLTENVVPTVFFYTKPNQKRLTTERRQINDAIQTNVEMELIDKKNLLIENSKSCQTEIAIPSMQSVSTWTNASNIALIDWLKKMKTTLQLSPSAVKLKSLQIMMFLFAQKKRFQKKKRKLKLKMNALKEVHS